MTMCQYAKVRRVNSTQGLARQNFLTECSITVVRMHGVHVVRVRFPAARLNEGE